jgi:hypothetical protein
MGKKSGNGKTSKSGSKSKDKSENDPKTPKTGSKHNDESEKDVKVNKTLKTDAKPKDEDANVLDPIAQENSPEGQTKDKIKPEEVLKTTGQGHCHVEARQAKTATLLLQSPELHVIPYSAFVKFLSD